MEEMNLRNEQELAYMQQMDLESQDKEKDVTQEYESMHKVNTFNQ